MITYLALYRGQTIDEARMVAATADPAVVARVAGQFLKCTELLDDPVVQALQAGERRALRLIAHQKRTPVGQQ